MKHLNSSYRDNLQRIKHQTRISQINNKTHHLTRTKISEMILICGEYLSHQFSKTRKPVHYSKGCCLKTCNPDEGTRTCTGTFVFVSADSTVEIHCYLKTKLTRKFVKQNHSFRLQQTQRQQLLSYYVVLQNYLRVLLHNSTYSKQRRHIKYLGNMFNQYSRTMTTIENILLKKSRLNTQGRIAPRVREPQILND